MAQPLSFGQYLSRGFQALPFKKEAVIDLRDDSNGKRNAFILITIVAVLVGIAAAAFLGVIAATAALDPNLSATFASIGAVGGFIVGFLIVFFGMLISCGLVHIFAKLLGGKASIMQYFSAYQATTLAVMIVAIIAEILGMIPFLGVLIMLAANIYSLVFSIFVVRETYEISTGRAIGAVLLPSAIIFVLVIVFFGMALIGAMSGAF